MKRQDLLDAEERGALQRELETSIAEDEASKATEARVLAELSAPTGTPEDSPAGAREESPARAELRSFLARLLGWDDAPAVERAFRSVERAVAHRAPLVLCGDGDLVPVAHACTAARSATADPSS